MRNDKQVNYVPVAVTCSARLQPRLRAGCGVGLYPTQTSHGDLKMQTFKCKMPKEQRNSHLNLRLLPFEFCR